MRDETLRELDRIAGGQVRPLGAFEARQLGKILEVDSRRAACLHERIEGFRARRSFVFELLERTAHRETYEDNFAATGLEFFHCANGVAEALLNRLLHFRAEDFWRDITGRWRRRE